MADVPPTVRVWVARLAQIDGVPTFTRTKLVPLSCVEVCIKAGYHFMIDPFDQAAVTAWQIEQFQNRPRWWK